MKVNGHGMRRVLWGVLVVVSAVAGWLTVRYGMPSVESGWLVFAPLAVTLPPFVALIRTVGWPRAMVACLMLGCFFLLLSVVSAATGYPFGPVHVSDRLGMRIIGLVPWTMPFAGVGLLLGILPAAARWGKRIGWKFAWTSIGMAVVGVLAEASATVLGLWTYAHPFRFAGIPVSSVGGWALAGLVGGMLAFLLLQDHKPLPPLAASGLLLSCGFWVGTIGAKGNWVAAVFVILLFVGIFWIMTKPPEGGEAAAITGSGAG
jgi:uncharacterized membrane protein